MKKKYFILKVFVLPVIAILILSADMFSQEVNKVGTAAATFLRIPVGARASGMGSSFVSVTGDATSAFWNPANLSSVKSYSLAADHAEWMPGIDFDFVGAILPFEGIGTVGINITMLHTDEMLRTTPDEPMGTGETFTASSFALGFSYSRYLTDRFSIGGSFKYVRETIFNSSASGIAFDVGTIYQTPFAGIRLGASISNFGTKMQMTGDDLNVRVDIAPGQEGNNQSVIGKLNTDEFDMPLIMRIGISGEVINTEDIRLTLSADGINPNDNAQSINVGGELGLFNEIIRLRGGYKDLFLDENESGLAFGVGLNDLRVISTVSLSVDYAYQDFVHLKGSNRFTVVFKF